jgi:predicted nucleic acid-binding protein
VQDAWIAATARAYGAAVYTQDDDFDGLDVEVVRV